MTELPGYERPAVDGELCETFSEAMLAMGRAMDQQDAMKHFGISDRLPVWTLPDRYWSSVDRPLIVREDDGEAD